MGINPKLLPLKLHFFLFFGGAGAIVPYLVVFGKQLGISAMVMGTINGIQPLFYILIRPSAGVLMDYFHKRRSLIFSSSFLLMAIFCSMTYFTFPPSDGERSCSLEISQSASMKSNDSTNLQNEKNNLSDSGLPTTYTNEQYNNKSIENKTNHNGYPIQQQPSSTSVWTYLLFMVLGLLMFHICSSYSDTVCLDMLGDGQENQYGKQRVWGAIGYGICAGLSGFLVDMFSGDSGYRDNTPAFVILALLTILDILVSLKLKPSTYLPSQTMFKDVMKAIKNLQVAWFLLMTLVFGMCDSLLYFLLWYLEDISIVTGTFGKIRTIEGAILMGQTLIGETLFFNVSGYIIDKIGYNASSVLCLLLYALRFAILAVIPNIWWALPSESILHASFGLAYTLVVSYTNHISTSGIQATMQSVSMAFLDGFGYALGSFLGGLSLKYIGGRGTFALMSLLCLLTAVMSTIVFAFLNFRTKRSKVSQPAVAS